MEGVAGCLKGVWKKIRGMKSVRPPPPPLFFLELVIASLSEILLFHTIIIGVKDFQRNQKKQ